MRVCWVPVQDLKYLDNQPMNQSFGDWLKYVVFHGAPVGGGGYRRP
jgi:hypothetical protein